MSLGVGERKLGFDVNALVKPDRVHGRLYTDPDIFLRELEEIWHKVWVYIGHESEIPQAGDYVRREIGVQPVIMIRGGDGEIRVLYNRCQHRANLVCHKNRGTAAELTCPYHGWSYATTGALIAPSFGEAYDLSILRGAEFGLARAARQETYRGFVFASAAASGISLDEHLGLAKELLDFIIERSPAGKVALTAGVQCVRYRGNWKMLPENSIEGNYHGNFIHKFAFGLNDRRLGRTRTPNARRPADQEDEVLSLPGGHMVQDFRRQPSPPQLKQPSAARIAYVNAMIEVYGDARARELTEKVAPMFYIFPNLIFIQTHFRRVQPIAVDDTYAHYQPALLEDAPAEMNRGILRAHEEFFGPAGFLVPDDFQMMERNQIAVQAEGGGWLYLGRGVHREKRYADGMTTGHLMDENQLRGMWRHYARLMTGP